MSKWSYSETFGGSGWKSFDDYFQNKGEQVNRHVKENYTGENGKCESLIFKNCVFWIDGRTRVSDHRLKMLMIRHGGEYEAYNLARVTHFVADNLAIANQRWRKIRDSGRARFSVVTSEWVVASVQKGSLLSENFFTPDCLKNPAQGFGSMLQFLSAPGTSNDTARAETSLEERTTTMPHNPDSVVPSRPLQDVKAMQRDPSSSVVLCTDYQSNFVRNFFSASRLHFIGRWRQRLASKFSFSPFTPLPLDLTSWNSVETLPPVTLQEYFREKPFKVPPKKKHQGSDMAPKTVSEFLHVDFDAFFVSVAMRKHPQLQNQPVAVCHGTGSNSGSEIASCNYVARTFGVQKGMWLRDAKSLCCDLCILPYDFEEIEQASLAMMDILTDVTSRVLPVSCDEAYVQLVGEYEVQHCEQVAEWIRETILRRTSCSVSIGIGPNLLLSKLATSKAKPNLSIPNAGSTIYRVNAPYKDFMASLPLEKLPGIGPRAVEKLLRLNLSTCSDVITHSDLKTLQRCLGEKQGLMCYSFCFGCDPRPFPCLGSQLGGLSNGHSERSLTISINWGIRLTLEVGVQNLFKQIAEECELRLAHGNQTASEFHLKILRRSAHAPIEPAKYGGCGECDEVTQRLNISPKSVSHGFEIYPHLYSLWQMCVAARFCEIPDLRGVSVIMGQLKEKITRHDKKRPATQSFSCDQTYNSDVTSPHENQTPPGDQQSCVMSNASEDSKDDVEFIEGASSSRTTSAPPFTPPKSNSLSVIESDQRACNHSAFETYDVATTPRCETAVSFSVKAGDSSSQFQNTCLLLGVVDDQIASGNEKERQGPYVKVATQPRRTERSLPVEKRVNYIKENSKPFSMMEMKKSVNKRHRVEISSGRGLPFKKVTRECSQRTLLDMMKNNPLTYPSSSSGNKIQENALKYQSHVQVQNGEVVEIVDLDDDNFGDRLTSTESSTMPSKTSFTSSSLIPHAEDLPPYHADISPLTSRQALTRTEDSPAHGVFETPLHRGCTKQATMCLLSLNVNPPMIPIQDQPFRASRSQIWPESHKRSEADHYPSQDHQVSLSVCDPVDGEISNVSNTRENTKHSLFPHGHSFDGLPTDESTHIPRPHSPKVTTNMSCSASLEHFLEKESPTPQKRLNDSAPASATPTKFSHTTSPKDSTKEKDDLFQKLFTGKHHTESVEKNFINLCVDLSDSDQNSDDASLYSQVELVYCPNVVCITLNPLSNGEEENTTQGLHQVNGDSLKNHSSSSTLNNSLIVSESCSSMLTDTANLNGHEKRNVNGPNTVLSQPSSPSSPVVSSFPKESLEFSFNSNKHSICPVLLTQDDTPVTTDPSNEKRRLFCNTIDVIKRLSSVRDMIENRARMFNPDIEKYRQNQHYTHEVCGGSHEGFSRLRALEGFFAAPFSTYSSWLSQSCWMCLVDHFVLKYMEQSSFLRKVFMTQFASALVMLTWLMVSLSDESQDFSISRLRPLPCQVLFEEIWGFCTCLRLYHHFDIRHSFLAETLFLLRNPPVLSHCAAQMLSKEFDRLEHPVKALVQEVWHLLKWFEQEPSKNIKGYALFASLNNLTLALEESLNHECRFLS